MSINLIDQIRDNVATLRLAHKIPTAIEMTQVGKDRLISEMDNMLIGNDIAVGMSAYEQIDGLPIRMTEDVPNGFFRVLSMWASCDHKWINIAWSFDGVRQYCKRCGRERKQGAPVPLPFGTQTYNMSELATADFMTLLTQDKRKVITHNIPLSRRLCLNIRVAKWKGYTHFHLSSLGNLCGFRPATDHESPDTKIVDVGEGLEVMDRLPDYSRDLNAAWGLFNRDSRVAWVLDNEWPNMPPEKVAALICRAYDKAMARRKMDTLDRG